MKVFVGTLVYDGKVPCEVLTCMLNESTIANSLGIELRFNFIPSCSHAAMGRNQLVRDFLESDCDKLFWLDSDVTWNPGDLLKITQMPYHVVGGAYRYKCEEEKYPVNFPINKELWANEHGLLEVQDLPGGFLAVSREAYNRIAMAHPDRMYDHYGKPAFCFYQFAFQDGKFYGEDTLFCKEWRDLGESIYLDPELTLTHWQFPVKYEGKIGDFLKQVNNMERIGGDECQNQVN